MGDESEISILPDLIRTIRGYLDLNQVQFGEETGVSDDTVGRWENGRGVPGIEQETKIINLCENKSVFPFAFRDYHFDSSDELARVFGQARASRSAVSRRENVGDLHVRPKKKLWDWLTAPPILAIIVGSLLIVGSLSYVFVRPLFQSEKTSEIVRHYGESVLSNWESDFSSNGEISTNDVIVDNSSGIFTELIANPQQRPVSVDLISFFRVIDEEAFDYLHESGYLFRLPYDLGSDFSLRPQTIEGGFFTWDGSGSRLDIGLGWQWILNPSDKDYGYIRTWTSSQGKGKWQRLLKLEPDTIWHEVEMIVDYRDNKAYLSIDQKKHEVQLSETQKGDANVPWGTETAVRLQAEVISVDPGDEGLGAVHKAQFKDWYWTVLK